MMARLAGIELGGTKAIVVLGQPGAIAERHEYPTTTPDETLGRAVALIAAWHAAEPLAALGVASFGPVRVSPEAPDFGMILDTPKPGWAGTSLVQRLQAVPGLPLAIDTDVNAAALAEHRLGAAQGCDSLVYVTIGTGLGAGIVIEGRPVHGLLHPEVGHLRLRRAAGDRFGGSCPFHGDCIEGLVSGPALAARFGRHPAEVAADEPAWGPVAADLAELLAMLMLTLSPRRIVVGGGVSARQPQLLAMASALVPGLLAGYLGPVDAAALAGCIVASVLGNDAGPTGALVLAQDMLRRLPPA